MNVNIILGIVFGGSGIVLLIVGACFWIPYNRVSRLSGITTGRVVDKVKDQISFNQLYEKKLEEDYGRKRKGSAVFSRGNGDNRNITVFHPVFEFYVNGITYRRAGNVAHDIFWINQNMGKIVTIHYDPTDPFSASLSDGRVYRNLSIGLCLGGVISCAAACIFFIVL